MNASNLREDDSALGLALLAVVRGTPAHGLSTKWLSTLKAGFALTVVHLVVLLVVAGLGVGVHELLIVQGGTTVLDGFT
jgi:hypothetical protein